MRIVLRHLAVLAVLAPALFLMQGCGGDDEESPQYDSTGSQILWRLFDSLAEGESEQALREIARLEAITGPSRFYELAKEQENLRIQLQEATQILYSGRARHALERLRRLAQRYPGRPEIQQAVERCAALAALQNSEASLPQDWAQEQRRILASLDPHLTILAASPSFQDWLDRQQQQLRLLTKREDREARRQLRSELDLALVSHRSAAALVLAQLMIKDEEAKRALIQQGVSGSGGARRPLLPLNSALSLLAFGNRAFTFESNAEPAQPIWRSQLLLSSLRQAGNGRWTTAFAGISSVAVESRLDGHYITTLTASYLPAGPKRGSPPWVIPCPSVSEVLQRIVDIAE